MLGSLVVRLEEGEEGVRAGVEQLLKSFDLFMWSVHGFEGFSYTFENLCFCLCSNHHHLTSIFFQDKNKFLLISCYCII